MQRICYMVAIDRIMWTASADGSIKLWGMDTYAFIANLTHKTSTSYPIKYLLHVHSDKPQVWSTSPREKSIYCWDSKVFISLSPLSLFSTALLPFLSFSHLPLLLSLSIFPPYPPPSPLSPRFPIPTFILLP